MRVLLFNGSPRANGCTFTALSEIAKTLNAENIETEILQIGNKPIQDCIGCGGCIGKCKCVFNNDSVNEWLKGFEQKHGFKHIPPHSLRHTCNTMQLNAGVPLKVVSTRAGHSNERITLDIYTHALKSQDKQAADTYNKFLMGV